jgi:DNA-directed RNA polymerase specialized sigma24 family protein
MSYPFQALDLAPDAGSLRETPSLEELYQRYHEPLQRYLYRLCGSTDQDEELTQ